MGSSIFCYPQQVNRPVLLGHDEGSPLEVTPTSMNHSIAGSLKHLTQAFWTFRLKLTRQGCEGAITMPSPIVDLVTPSTASSS